VNQSGKWFKVIPYGVGQSDSRIDYDVVEGLAHESKPKLILAGGSAYPRIIDFARFRRIADSVGAYFMVDMAHIAGLVAGGVHPSPLPHAHVVTTTTHKSLRGPRGGMILGNDDAIAKTLAASLEETGLDIVSGGTDNHLMLVDLRPKNATGKRAEAALGRANITCNKNGIPFDPEKPFVTSGVRLATPAGTTRGFGQAEFREIGRLITEVLDGLKTANSDEGNAAVEAAVRDKVAALTERFPLYPYMG